MRGLPRHASHGELERPAQVLLQADAQPDGGQELVRRQQPLLRPLLRAGGGARRVDQVVLAQPQGAQVEGRHALPARRGRLPTEARRLSTPGMMGSSVNYIFKFEYTIILKPLNLTNLTTFGYYL